MLPPVANVASVPQQAESADDQKYDAEDGPADEDPSHALDIRFGVAAQPQADPII